MTSRRLRIPGLSNALTKRRALYAETPEDQRNTPEFFHKRRAIRQSIRSMPGAREELARRRARRQVGRPINVNPIGPTKGMLGDQDSFAMKQPQPGPQYPLNSGRKTQPGAGFLRHDVMDLNNGR